jgi:hypothetical protein
MVQRLKERIPSLRFIALHNDYGIIVSAFLIQCRDGGRTTDFNNVLSVQDVSQIGEDPLVVFDGLM